MYYKAKFLIPFIILFALLGLLWRELFYANPHEIPSALIGENVPQFSLPILTKENSFFTNKELVGHVSLINVWATWCYACAQEHDMLLKIKENYHVPIYSINYKDNQRDALNWLLQHGNPYVLTGSDKNGDVAIDFGVYGTPETFVISPQGKIIYRHIGAIDQATWDNILYPLVKQYETHP